MKKLRLLAIAGLLAGSAFSVGPVAAAGVGSISGPTTYQAPPGETFARLIGPNRLRCILVRRGARNPAGPAVCVWRRR